MTEFDQTPDFDTQTGPNWPDYQAAATQDPTFYLFNPLEGVSEPVRMEFPDLRDQFDFIRGFQAVSLDGIREANRHEYDEGWKTLAASPMVDFPLVLLRDDLTIIDPLFPPFDQSGVPLNAEQAFAVNDFEQQELFRFVMPEHYIDEPEMAEFIKSIQAWLRERKLTDKAILIKGYSGVSDSKGDRSFNVIERLEQEDPDDPRPVWDPTKYAAAVDPEEAWVQDVSAWHQDHSETMITFDGYIVWFFQSLSFLNGVMSAIKTFGVDQEIMVVGDVFDADKLYKLDQLNSQ